MHPARLASSERLQRVLGVLKACGDQGVTSWSLMQMARVVAPATAISELRHQGYEVRCEQVMRDGKRVWKYTLQGSGQSAANPSQETA